MKMKNLAMSSTKAFALVRNGSSVTQYLQAGWDVRFDYLLIPPLVDPVTVQIPGFTALVSNGSVSRIKWPVAGAFSKWNILGYPYTVIDSGQSASVDVFKLYPTVGESQPGWTYSTDLFLKVTSNYVFYPVGVYDPITKVGLTTGASFFDDRNFLHNIGVNPVDVIRECPDFDLPARIQLRITLIRVKEN
jgi:hypothetical protein